MYRKLLRTLPYRAVKAIRTGFRDNFNFSNYVKDKLIDIPLEAIFSWEDYYIDTINEGIDENGPWTVQGIRLRQAREVFDKVNTLPDAVKDIVGDGATGWISEKIYQEFFSPASYVSLNELSKTRFFPPDVSQRKGTVSEQLTENLRWTQKRLESLNDKYVHRENMPSDIKEEYDTYEYLIDQWKAKLRAIPNPNMFPHGLGPYSEMMGDISYQSDWEAINANIGLDYPASSVLFGSHLSFDTYPSTFENYGGAIPTGIDWSYSPGYDTSLISQKEAAYRMAISAMLEREALGPKSATNFIQVASLSPFIPKSANSLNDGVSYLDFSDFVWSDEPSVSTGPTLDTSLSSYLYPNAGDVPDWVYKIGTSSLKILGDDSRQQKQPDPIGTAIGTAYDIMSFGNTLTDVISGRRDDPGAYLSLANYAAQGLNWAAKSDAVQDVVGSLAGYDKALKNVSNVTGGALAGWGLYQNIEGLASGDFNVKDVLGVAANTSQHSTQPMTPCSKRFLQRPALAGRSGPDRDPRPPAPGPLHRGAGHGVPGANPRRPGGTLYDADQAENHPPGGHQPLKNDGPGTAGSTNHHPAPNPPRAVKLNPYVPRKSNPCLPCT